VRRCILSVIAPFSYSAFYWGTAFAQEPDDQGPPATPPLGDLSLIPEFSDGTAIISSSTTTTVDEPPDVTEFNNGTVIISSITDIQEFNNGTVIISSSTTTTGPIDEPPVDEPPPPDKLLSIVIINDIINFIYTNGTIPPNATEAWQFENNTDDDSFNDDATITDTEGINGTSLLLDGD